MPIIKARLNSKVILQKFQTLMLKFFHACQIEAKIPLRAAPLLEAFLLAAFLLLALVFFWLLAFLVLSLPLIELAVFVFAFAFAMQFYSHIFKISQGKY